MAIKEMGGYLPLELPSACEYYHEDGGQIRRYNSGRSAIYQAVVYARAARIWLPVYLCTSVCEFMKRKGVDVVFYNIDSEFLPVSVCPDENDIVLWVNYFGVMNHSKVQEILRRYPCVIIDNTQAFYFPPQKNAYNVYSCRKFFGVNDGSYLISDFISGEQEDLPKSRSLDTIGHLLGCIEESTNTYYEANLRNEQRLEAEDVMDMSNVTKRILSSVDYAGAAERRIRNFEKLNGLLGKYNLLRLETPEYAPMVYPLLIDDPQLRAWLVKNKIYVPQWWKAAIENEVSNDWEKFLSANIIPLPVDHRYSEDDMRSVADTVLKKITRI